MGQVQTSTLDPSCCFRQGRSRTLCAPEKEKPSCSGVTKCLNQTDDMDQTKIKTAQKGQQQSSYAGLKFSSLLRGLCLQEPLLGVTKPMAPQWQHLGVSLLPPEHQWHPNPGGWAGGVWGKPHTGPNIPMLCQPHGSACPRHTAGSWDPLIFME